MQRLVDIAAGIDSSKLEEEESSPSKVIDPTNDTLTNGYVASSNGSLQHDELYGDEGLVNGHLDGEQGAEAEVTEEQEFGLHQSL